MADFTYNAAGPSLEPGAPSTSHAVPVQSSSQIRVDKDDPRVRDHSMIMVRKKDGSVVRLWECALCYKRFKYQYTLARHIPVHTDDRCYRCPICPKAFRQLSTLTQHKVIHSEVRPFSCEFCFKTFNRISTLSSHRQTHFTEKKYVCTVCGKGFHQKGNLRNHLFTHTNERPYKCDVCKKGFNQKSNLACHKTSAHPQKTYTCEICSKTFNKLHAYNVHHRKVHEVISKKGTKMATASRKKSAPLKPEKYLLIQNNNDSTIDMNVQALQVPKCSQPAQTGLVNLLLPVQDIDELVFRAGEPEVKHPVSTPYRLDEADHRAVTTDEAKISSTVKSKKRLNIPSMENTCEVEEIYREFVNSCPTVVVPNARTLQDPPPPQILTEPKTSLKPDPSETLTSPEIPRPAPKSSEVEIRRVPVSVNPPGYRAQPFSALPRPRVSHEIKIESGPTLEPGLVAEEVRPSTYNRLEPIVYPGPTLEPGLVAEEVRPSTYNRLEPIVYPGPTLEPGLVAEEVRAFTYNRLEPIVYPEPVEEQLDEVGEIELPSALEIQEALNSSSFDFFDDLIDLAIL